MQPNVDYSIDYYCDYIEKWCQPCNTKRLQQSFKNWTSGNNEVNEFIQKVQLKARNYREILEWIEYDKFEDIKYVAKEGFGTIHKAIWKNGYIRT
ncbi:hypothetical protein RclHR1_03100006 [Rhizophagus clarus]|uniref:Kinase-like domain-containing protein n=1 Tax=Rhizophagus clarus TaxID=94130 RepID=A0A2Z6RIQ0_9GLOM|nr:hypothetical protein RclHR1_03100006 [Rhizophagus clarus]GES93926.1 kinase-like domain-containing protein [Rhizophagus clarus]